METLHPVLELLLEMETLKVGTSLTELIWKCSPGNGVKSIDVIIQTLQTFETVKKCIDLV